MRFFVDEISLKSGEAPRQNHSDRPLRPIASDLGVSPEILARFHKPTKKHKSREKFHFELILFIALLLPACPAFALVIPDKPQSYVNDYAGLLSGETKQKLEKQLYEFEQATSNQVVVAVFSSLDGWVLEDFSIKLAEKWKIGSKENDNGVILSIFKEDRAVRIEVGYGLEGALPDATARMIIQNEIVPSFRAGNFDEGVTQAVAAILSATRGEYKAAPKEDPMETYAPAIFVFIFLFFLAPFLGYVAIIGFSSVIFGMPGFFISLVVVALLEFLRRVFISPHFGQTFFSGHHGGWGRGGGGGGFSGGFSGGGGGSFGGGGASGRW